MNKFLIASIAALVTLMVLVEESHQQTTAPPEPPAPTIYEGCTCVGKPQRDRPERERREAGGFGGRGGPRRGPRGGRPQPNLSQLPAAFSDTEANTVGGFFCACPN